MNIEREQQNRANPPARIAHHQQKCANGGRDDSLFDGPDTCCSRDGALLIGCRATLVRARDKKRRPMTRPRLKRSANLRYSSRRSFFGGPTTLSPERVEGKVARLADKECGADSPVSTPAVALPPCRIRLGKEAASPAAAAESSPNSHDVEAVAVVEGVVAVAVAVAVVVGMVVRPACVRTEPPAAGAEWMVTGSGVVEA